MVAAEAAGFVLRTPYGVERTGRSVKSGWVGLRGFVGGIEDSRLGLSRVGVRDYAYNRFVRTDPVIDFANDSQWNPYLYGNGDPVNQPDPSGAFPRATAELVIDGGGGFSSGSAYHMRDWGGCRFGGYSCIDSWEHERSVARSKRSPRDV